MNESTEGEVLSSDGSEFHQVGPMEQNARSPYVNSAELSRFTPANSSNSANHVPVSRIEFAADRACTYVSELDMGSGVAEWARVLTGDRTVNGSSLAAVKTFRFASELWQFRLPRLASVFRMRH